MNPVRWLLVGWLLGLTPHEMQVLEFLAVCTGSGLVPVFGLVLTWFAKGIKFSVRQAAEQTRRQDYVDGELRVISVADIAHRLAHDTNEFRGEFHSEINDLVNPIEIRPPVHGRRRNTPTNQVPTSSLYEGEHHDHTDQ